MPLSGSACGDPPFYGGASGLKDSTSCNGIVDAAKLRSTLLQTSLKEYVASGAYSLSVEMRGVLLLASPATLYHGNFTQLRTGKGNIYDLDFSNSLECNVSVRGGFIFNKDIACIRSCYARSDANPSSVS